MVSRLLCYYDVTESICRLVGPLLLGKIDAMWGWKPCEELLVLTLVRESVYE